MTTIPATARRYVTFKTSGVGSTTNDVGNDTILDGDTVSRSSNPNWRQDVARGNNASRPYFHSHLDYRPSSFFGDTFVLRTVAIPPVNPTSSVGGGITGFSAFQPFASNVYGPLSDSNSAAIAVARVRQKLASHTKAVNAVVPIVELREFRGLITQIAKLTSSALTTFIDLKKRGGRNVRKYAADSWLTFQFGVKPMVNDAGKIAESIAEFLGSTSHDVRLASSSPPIRRLLSGSRGAYNSLYATSRYHKLQGVSELSYRCVAGFHIPVKSANRYDLASQFGLDFSALPSILWELAPYSWAVDYFTNMGQYLDDVFMAPSGICNYVVVDRKFKADFSITTELRRDRPDCILNYFSRPGKGSYFEFERTVSSSLPTPVLRFRTLDEVGRNWTYKVLNLASILAQRR